VFRFFVKGVSPVKKRGEGKVLSDEVGETPVGSMSSVIWKQRKGDSLQQGGGRCVAVSTMAHETDKFASGQQAHGGGSS